VLDIAEVSATDQDRDIVHSIDLRVHKGEIVGIAGVEGNGQNELIEVLLGVRPVSAGSVSLDGRDITREAVRSRRELGIDYIPADRHRYGLLLDAPLWENAMLGHQSEAPYVRGLWIDRKAAKDMASEIVERFDVRTPGIDTAAHALSGGNQQKFIIGREMITEPSLLIASHPTRGIDVGAQAAVWEQLRQARSEGLAVLLVSADLDELIGLSDVLQVMLRGELVAELDPADVTPRDLGSYMTGAAIEGAT
jgi:simple sugar transport system ATP-binding protein